MKRLFYALFLLSCITTASYAMEEKIEIYTVAEKHVAFVPVNTTTTVLDIKTSLHNTDGIPVERQHLRAMILNPWTLEMTSKASEELLDDANVAFVMENYNAKALMLCLTLP